MTDNDTASVTITEAGGSSVATEGGITDSYTVVLTTEPTSTVQIVFATSTLGVTLSTSTITFSTTNWNSAQTITITATDDSVDEASPTNTSITHTASSTNFGYVSGLSISSVTAAVTDNDVAGITATTSTLSLTEGGSNRTYTYVLDTQPTSTVLIVLSTSTLGLTLSTSTVFFTNATWNIPQSVSASATDDLVYENTHVTSVVHAIASTDMGYSSLAYSGVSATITDNDSASVTITESGGSTAATEGGSTDTYSVVLTSEPTSTVQILFTTSTFGVTLSTSTITFSTTNWNSAQTITVTATDDSVDEVSPHASPITHTASSTNLGYGSSVSISSITSSVTDNDVASVTITESGGSTNVLEGSTIDAYSLVLVTEPTTTVQIILSGIDSRQLAPTPTTTFTFTSMTWNIPQTVTVTPFDDSIVEGRHRANISHQSSSTGFGYASLSISSLSVDIQDNDFPPTGGGGGGGGGSGGSSGSGSGSGSSGSTGEGQPTSITMTTPTPIIVTDTAPSSPPVLPPITVASSTPVLAPTVSLESPFSSPVVSPPSSEAERRGAEATRADARAFSIPLPSQSVSPLASFIAHGVSSATRSLGEGERRAVLRDAFETMRRSDIPLADLDRMTRGQIPSTRNIPEERRQLPRVLQTFRTIYRHDPDFENVQENLAWNTLMYRIRFPRDLEAERGGIRDFREVFSRLPSSPFSWAAVRVMGYVMRERR